MSNLQVQYKNDTIEQVVVPGAAFWWVHGIGYDIRFHSVMDAKAAIDGMHDFSENYLHAPADLE